MAFGSPTYRPQAACQSVSILIFWMPAMLGGSLDLVALITGLTLITCNSVWPKYVHFERLCVGLQAEIKVAKFHEPPGEVSSCVRRFPNLPTVLNKALL